MDREDKLRQKVIKQVYDLAFGSDEAAKIVFMDEEEARRCLEYMDMRRVVSVHRAASGAVEVKFSNRAELIELLLEATRDSMKAAGGGSGLLEAIMRSAAGDEENV